MTERLPHPPMLRAFPFNVALRLFMKQDIRATQEQLDAFRTFATLGDPLADALVAEMRTLPAGEGRRQFEQAIDHGIDTVDDPPPALAAFFADVEAVPAWLDRDKLDLAARTVARAGLLPGMLTMVDLGLMGGYLASKPDKVLVRSGDLEKKAARRLAETAKWGLDVTSPGGLDRFAPGFTGVLRVRITHAHIRAAMHARDDWDYENWDDPVNQVHMVGTLVLFSAVLVIGLQAMGYRFADRERDAIYHLWRYVGHLMGVHPDLLPADEGDTWRIVWLEAATEFIPDDDSHRLAQALFAAIPEYYGINGTDPASRLAAWGVKSLHASYTRLTIGGANADALGLPNRPPFHAPILAFAAANFAVETVRQRIPGATRLSALLGDRIRHAAMRRVAGRTRADLTYTREPVAGSRAARAAA
jgi:mpaB/rubber oxygenase-like protein